MRRTQIASILIALVVITRIVPFFAQTPAEVFDVLGYTATIRPDIAAKTVAGDVDIRLRILAADVRTIEFDRGELVVDDVRASSERLAFDLLPKRVRVQLVKPEAPGTELALSIAYHGAPRNGLQFVPERQQAYTIFSTSQWLICVDAPADKATLDLRVVLPAGLHAVGIGTLVSETPGPNGTVVHRWREERPISSYLFGFAAGRFVESRPERAGTALRYIGEGVSVEELNRIFGDTPDMLEFFATHAGVAYPRDSYEQVLVANTAGQEAWGFALFSDAYGRAVLDDPSGVWLIAHELAHQWWGNLVTCQDWNHFWLNEGFASFMADAYDEHRFGREAYLKDVERARARYEAVREAGHDRSLVFPDWNHPTTDDRTLVYQKGAYVLHLLREQMGDEAFWNGIRHYTTRYAGGSVTTDDFKQSMEQSSGMKLDAFFDRWIYARS